MGTQKNKNKKAIKSKKSIFLVIFIFVILVGLSVLVFSPSRNLMDPVKNQLSALRAGDLAKAYSYTSQDFQQVSSLDVFKSYVEHYPQLKENAGVSITDKQLNGNEGILMGTLKAKNGETVSVEYRLVKEGGKWKIAYMNLGDVTGGAANSSFENVYRNKEYRYSIHYPSNWDYQNEENAKVLFSGKKGTSSYNSLVTIQAIDPTIMTQKVNELQDLVSLLLKQMSDVSSNFKVINEGDVELASDPKKYYGKYFIATYDFEGSPFKKMQFVLQSDDGKLYYTWSYTSPIDQFDVDLPTVKSMYESWEIK